MLEHWSFGHGRGTEFIIFQITQLYALQNFGTTPFFLPAAIFIIYWERKGGNISKFRFWKFSNFNTFFLLSICCNSDEGVFTELSPQLEYEESLPGLSKVFFHWVHDGWITYHNCPSFQWYRALTFLPCQKLISAALKKELSNNTRNTCGSTGAQLWD